MTSASNNPEVFFTIEVVYQPVGMVNMPAPSLSIFQRLGLAYTFRQAISLNIFDKVIYLLGSFLSTDCQ